MKIILFIILLNSFCYSQKITVGDNGKLNAGGIGRLIGIVEETGGIFTSGFEHEVDAMIIDFTSKEVNGTSTINIDNSERNSGFKSALSTFSSDTGQVRFWKDFGVLDTVYARFYFKINSSFEFDSLAGFVVAAFSNNISKLLGTSYAVCFTLAPLDIDNMNIIKFGSFAYTRETEQPALTFYDLPDTIITKDIWHQIQIIHKSYKVGSPGSSIHALVYDDITIYSNTGASISVMYGLSRLNFNISYRYNSNSEYLYHPKYLINGSKIWYDDVKIDTLYIGNVGL